MVSAREIVLTGGALARQSVGASRRLYPGYFALVMATGILSNAFFLLHRDGLSEALLWVNLIAFPVLCGATILRAARFRSDLWADLTSPELVFSFFTFVAGSDVLGIQLLMRGHETAARALWITALATWVFLSYFSFSVLIFVNTRRGADVVHGGWLIAIVGTQSLVLLGTLLAPGMGEPRGLVLLGVHCLWGIGIALYGIFITLFSYRIFFVRVGAAQMNPLFWVIMGASAISANAGSALIKAALNVPFLLALRPFVEGITLILWAWSTWWIPLLVVVGIWKYAVRHVPLAYEPGYWSVVFPLGMYTVATHRLSMAGDLAALRAIPQVMVWVAMVAWSVTMLGLLKRLARALGQAWVSCAAEPGMSPPTLE